MLTANSLAILATSGLVCFSLASAMSLAGGWIGCQFKSCPVGHKPSPMCMARSRLEIPALKPRNPLLHNPRCRIGQRKC